jgi:tRNA pseudouridine38-40 synthase
VTRYRITIEYDGSGFVGWQRQKNGHSVQAAIEEALKRFCGETITVAGAGRTDTGVHALAQVAHFDLARKTTAKVVQNALNFHLKPAAIAVINTEETEPDFHSRFMAKARIYRYRIINRRSPLALEKGRAWWVPAPLNKEAMAAAARCLEGHHDFTSFRATKCQAKSPVRTLDELSVCRENDEILITARAPSFLHHQVRNFAGTLRLVGEGKWSIDDVTRALTARDRAAAGPTAPACGLYLLAVRY